MLPPNWYHPILSPSSSSSSAPASLRGAGEAGGAGGGRGEGRRLSRCRQRLFTDRHRLWDCSTALPVPIQILLMGMTFIYLAVILGSAERSLRLESMATGDPMKSFHPFEHFKYQSVRVGIIPFFHSSFCYPPRKGDGGGRWGEEEEGVHDPFNRKRQSTAIESTSHFLSFFSALLVDCIRSIRSIRSILLPLLLPPKKYGNGAKSMIPLHSMGLQVSFWLS